MNRSIPLAVLASAAALTLPQAAGATTYCVAKPSCVASGGTDIPSVGIALSAAGTLSPGPDRIEIGPGDFDAMGGFAYSTAPGDGVDIVGSGRGITRLVDSGSGAAETTLRMIGAPESSVSDLTIVAPAPSNQGPTTWALTLSAKAKRIDVRGPNSFVAVQMHGGASIADSTIEGSSGHPAVNVTGGSSISGSSIRTSGTALSVGSAALNISRSRIEASTGADVSGSGSLSIDDSLVVTHGGPGLATDVGGITTLTAMNDTIVGDGSSTGIVAGQGGNGAHTHVSLQNTTISGYAESIHANQAGGAVDAKVTASNYDPATVVSSPGQLDGSQGNVNVDPRFVDAANGDFHLRPDSALIDAGSAAGVADADLDGAKRSLDGNGDGSAVPDIGAYEAPALPVKTPDPVPAPVPSLQPPPPTPQTSPPVIKSLSYAHTRFRVALSKKARVKITIRRTHGRALGSLTRSLPAGKSTIAFRGRIGRHKLHRGSYIAVAIASDRGGHRSKKRSVTLRW